MRVSLYAKAAVAVISAILIAFIAKMTDNVVSPVEWVQIILAGTTAFLVWYKENTVNQPAAKTVAAVVMAVGSLFATYLVPGHHITVSEWINLALAGLTAAGVYVLPNKTVKPNVSRTRKAA